MAAKEKQAVRHVVHGRKCKRSCCLAPRGHILCEDAAVVELVGRLAHWRRSNSTADTTGARFFGLSFTYSGTSKANEAIACCLAHAIHSSSAVVLCSASTCCLPIVTVALRPRRGEARDGGNSLAVADQGIGEPPDVAGQAAGDEYQVLFFFFFFFLGFT